TSCHAYGAIFSSELPAIVTTNRPTSSFPSITYYTASSSIHEKYHRRGFSLGARFRRESNLLLPCSKIETVLDPPSLISCGFSAFYWVHGRCSRESYTGKNRRA